MKGISKRFFAYHYDPSTMSFHIVARIKDEPGSLGKLLQALKDHVNLIVEASYRLGDGTSMVSAFAEPTSAGETAQDLKAVIAKAGSIDAEVFKSKGGFLIDTFHNGIDQGGTRRYMILPQDSLARMYSQIAHLFGTGGETILYNQGAYLGETNMKRFMQMMSPRELDERLAYSTNLYGALGWGNARLESRTGSDKFIYIVDDCFECANTDASRTGCSFMRGHITGSLNQLFGEKFDSEETKCRFRHDEFCEFRIERKSPA